MGGIVLGIAVSAMVAGAVAILQGCETVDPDVSPDGAWVAFVAVCDGDMDLWRARIDGSEATRLTATAGDEHGPSWSPDGSRIAYAYAGEGVRSEIMVMAMDGSDPRALTDNGTTEWSPTWSPDGTRIAYESHRDGNADIYVLALGNDGETRLTTHPGRDVAPAWSPDGSTIAFQTDREGRYVIYGIHPDGGAPPEPLVSREGDAVTPDWGPGGALVFALQPAGEEDTELWISGPDEGTDRADRPVTGNDRIDFAPSWSPEGGWIVFMIRTPDEGWSLRMIRPDGSGERDLRPRPAAGGATGG